MDFSYFQRNPEDLFPPVQGFISVSRTVRLKTNGFYKKYYRGGILEDLTRFLSWDEEEDTWDPYLSKNNRWSSGRLTNFVE